MKIFTQLLIICLLFLGIAGCTPQEKKKVDIRFKKNIIYSEFISEGVAVGDVNNDGLTDILAGPLWFEAPNWVKHQIFPIGDYDYTKGYSDSFLNYVHDVNNDGWIDFICFDFPGKEVYWFENPKGEEKDWKRYEIDSTASNESPMFVDANNDGVMDLVFGSGNKEMMIFSVPQANSSQWSPSSISGEGATGTLQFSHGMGFGDINGDGRNDVMVTDGWWESPEDKSKLPWNFHKADLGKPCSQMYAYDFDKDGDSDVLSASAHAYGIWWHEQQGTSFVTHEIDTSFSETHAVMFDDINNDGLPDFITGKRFFSHQGHGPGGMEPAVLYWFELQHADDGKPIWTRHLIDDNSGVGIQSVVNDLNGDEKKDIIIANKKGVFYFEQE